MNCKLEQLAEWYTCEQLDFDKLLVGFRYRSIKPYFKGKTALEMGPADGVMTNLLVNDFNSLDLVEGSANLLALIQEYPNIRKFHALFEEFEPDCIYDTIIMEHVLEHIEHPTEVLRRVQKWLAPGGILIVGVPNAKSFHRLAAVKMGLLKSEYDLNKRDIALGHFRVYDPDKLRADIEEAGLRVCAEGGVYFKPLSNRQIQENWSFDMVEAFYQLGKDFSKNAAECFIVASPT